VARGLDWLEFERLRYILLESKGAVL